MARTGRPKAVLVLTDEERETPAWTNEPPPPDAISGLSCVASALCMAVVGDDGVALALAYYSPI